MNVSGVEALNYILAARRNQTKKEGVATNYSGWLTKSTESKDDSGNDISQTTKTEIKSRKLTEQEEMVRFQQEFYAEIAKIPMSGQLNTLAIRVTDEGWKRMKENPEYREKMMSLIKRDTTGTYFGKTNEIITIGRSSAEYRASSFPAERKVDDKERSIKRRKKKKKELQELYERMQLKRALEQDLMEKLGEGEFTLPEMPTAHMTMMTFTPNLFMAAM